MYTLKILDKTNNCIQRRPFFSTQADAEREMLRCQIHDLLPAAAAGYEIEGSEIDWTDEKKCENK